MQFILGIITGLLVSILIVITLTYFKKVIENKAIVIQKTIENAGPSPRGFIVEPKTDAEYSREEIINNNVKNGRVTPINELI